MLQYLMKRFYIELEQVYARVESQTTKRLGNPCGECSYCCEAGMASHRVTELEFEFLEARTTPAKARDFRDYIRRQSNEDGQLLFPKCPFYEQGCTIHTIRPLSCRLYGNFQTQSEVIPDFCVFKEQAVRVSPEGQVTELPGNRELKALATSHLSYSGASPRAVRSSRRRRRRRSKESRIERLMRLQVEERYLEALALSQDLLAAEPTALHWELQAEIQESLNQFDQAAQSYQMTLEITPDNPQLYYRLATVLTWSGQYSKAKGALQECLRLVPRHQNATGFQGVVCSLEQDWESAKKHFQAAVDLATEQAVAPASGVGPYNFQLASAHEKLGDLKLAVEQYRLAERYYPTEIPSRAALRRLKA